MTRQPAPRPTRTCECGKNFKQYRANQLYCSTKCRNRHHAKNRPTADDRAHLVKIAEMVGEADDVGAAWESVAAIIRNHNRLYDALKVLLENRQGAEVKATATFDDIDRVPEVLL